MNMLSVIIGIIFSNFFLDCFKSDPQYAVTFDRCYYQVCGVLIYCFVETFVWN
jgi:hypothetical protein